MNKIQLTQKPAVVNYTSIRNSMTLVVNAFYKNGLLPYPIVVDLREKISKNETLLQSVKELSELLVNLVSKRNMEG